MSKVGQQIAAPTYAFLTEEQLKAEQEKAKAKAYEKLQMPPVMDRRSEETPVLEKDESLQGYDSAQIVFTDITFGVHDRDRIIVARDPDGTLRHASPEQRDRLNQIYFPREGRKIYTPPMFEEDNLKEILKPNRYLYILDRNCAQFEPDHPIYIRTTQIVFDHVNENLNFDRLWSSRHYGPLVFHLVWERKVDDILAHYLLKANLSAISEVLILYAKLHPDSKFSSESASPPLNFDREETLKSLRSFINLASNKSTKLKGALETMLEIEESNAKAKKGMDQAHGS